MWGVQDGCGLCAARGLGRQLGGDPGVGARLADGGDGGHDFLMAAFQVGECAFDLGEAGGWQDEMCPLLRLRRQEVILDDQQFQVDEFIQVGQFAQDIERLDLPGSDALHDGVVTAFGRGGDQPGIEYTKRIGRAQERDDPSLEGLRQLVNGLDRVGRLRVVCDAGAVQNHGWPGQVKRFQRLDRCDVLPRLDLNPVVGALGQLGAARIEYDQLSALGLGLPDVERGHRVRGARIAADHEDRFGGADALNRGAAFGAQGLGKFLSARAARQGGGCVEVGRADGLGEFCQRLRGFVRQVRGGQHGDLVAGVGLQGPRAASRAASQPVSTSRPLSRSNGLRKRSGAWIISTMPNRPRAQAIPALTKP